jgi:1-deoxy-D-xylulose-5-phosphate reductoisomerase
MLVPLSRNDLGALAGKSKRRILVLGATGSIGTSTLDIIRSNPDKFEVVGLVAGSRAADLIKLADEFKPKYLGLGDSSKASELSGLGYKVAAGVDEISDLCTLPEVDIVLASMVGVVGLKPVIKALEAGKCVALANKESLVAGGSLVREALTKGKGSIIPVDSEHSALFQALQGETPRDMKRLILTASGGPFLNRSRDSLRNISPEEAVKHPRWNMGPKISIDSATMFNKALEVIEAHWLYGMPEDKIHVVIHPQSIIHSLIEYHDGSQMAQLSYPDMKGPISYALGYPDYRVAGAVRSLDLEDLGSLNFIKLDPIRFPAIPLARECIKFGGNASLVLNSANEAAVALFMERRIDFSQIESVVAEAVSKLQGPEPSSFEDLQQIDQESREFVKRIVHL